MVNYKCSECDGDIEIPDDALDGEIVSCPDCGEEYEVSFNQEKEKELNRIVAEREDWGE